MDPRGERSDQQSGPAPFVPNSYFPEPQYYSVNYYGSQCYYDEPQPLLQYYCVQPHVAGASASMRNEVAEISEESIEGAKTSGKRKSSKYETLLHAEERYLY